MELQPFTLAKDLDPHGEAKKGSGMGDWHKYQSDGAVKFACLGEEWFCIYPLVAI